MLAFLEGPELIIVLVVVLVLFGGAKLPKLARSIGQAKNEFERGVKDQPPAATVALPPKTPDKVADQTVTVTLSQAELDKLVADRVREATQQNQPIGEPPAPV